MLSEQGFINKLQKYFGLTWPGWLNIFIWTPILAALSYFMVNDILDLTNNYEQNNTAVELDVITKKTIVERPNDMTFCIPYYSSQLNQLFVDLTDDWIQKSGTNATFSCKNEICKAMQNHSWNVWTTIDRKKYGAPTNDFHGDLVMAIVKKVLNDSDEDLNILTLAQSNFNWNQPIVDAVWWFLSCMFRLDLQISVTPKTDLELVTLRVANGKFSCDSMNINFTEFGWTTNEIIDKMYERILNATNVYLSYSDTKPGVGETNLTFWGEKFCIQLLPNSTGQDFTYKSLDKLHRPPWNQSARAQKFLIWEDASPLFLEVENYDSVDAIYRTDYKQVDQLTYEYVQMDYSVVNRVIEQRTDAKCSPINTPAVCVAKKQFVEIIKHCRCVPFALQHLVGENRSDLSYCNLFDYFSCQDRLDKNKQIFWDECDVRCSNTFYTWKLITDSNVGYSKNNLNFYIRFEPKQKLFVQFTLIDKYTFSQFISGVGGLANFYLGLSGFTACVVLLYCINLGKRWRGLMVKKEESEQQQGSLFTRSSAGRNANETREQNNLEDMNGGSTKMQQEQVEISQKYEAKINRVLRDTQIEIRNMKETLAMQIETIKRELEKVKIVK